LFKTWMCDPGKVSLRSGLLPIVPSARHHC
jgi:hypothetical protein